MPNLALNLAGGEPGAGDVTGPASSTANAVALFNGTGGKTLKNSVVTIDGSGNIATAGTVDGVDVSTLGTTVSGNTSAIAANTAAIATKADILQDVNDQTGTTYTLQASDIGKLVRCTNAASITLTVPDSIVVAAGKRALVTVKQGGAGVITVVGSGTRTVTRPPTFSATVKTREQRSEVTLGLEGSTVCEASGDLAFV